MTSEVQTRHFRKTHFVAMEPANSSINSTNSSNTNRLLLNQNNLSNNQTSNTNLVYSSTSNQLASANKRNTIVKQFGDTNKHQPSDSSFDSAAGNSSSNHQAEVAGGCSSRGERDESDMGKNHVGPVMGIFFKVWSLVKVTKVRHQNKMRRQNSEDATHFQYVSGDQLPSNGSGSSHHRPALLQDRHFRRAGSQPAPSISGHQNSDNQHNQPNHYQQQHHQPMSWLQVSNSPATSGNASHFTSHPLAMNTTTTGTSSTSSGVSSTSSCVGQTMASSNNQTPSPPATNSVSAARRHLSAYSLRRSTADVLVPAATNNNNNNINKVKSNKSNDSWASKIKRSATTVNQADFSSYVSRYRFRARDQPPNGQQQRHKGNEGTSMSQFFSSRDTTPVHESEPRLFNGTIYNSDNNNNLELVVAASNEDCNNDDDEATSNDIYSTPNDSIQSVPSTEPVISNDKLTYGVSVSRQTPSQAHPIIKSFSTSSFNQLINKQQQSHQKFTPIHESSGAGCQVDDSCSKVNNRSDPNSKRLNSSRFFLSSSSSEDSNNQSTTTATTTTAANATNFNNAQNNSNNNHHHHHQTCLQLDQTIPETSLEQHQQQVAIQKGVHCHALQIQRPDTLFIHSQPGPFPMPVSLLTPAARCGLALPLLGPSSPLDCLPVAGGPLASGAVHRQHPMHQLPPSYLRSGYRKSPSLLEISSSSSSNGLGPPLPARGLSSRFSSKYPIQSSRVQLGHHSSALLEGNNGFRGTKVAPPLESQTHESIEPSGMSTAAVANEQLAPPLLDPNSGQQQQSTDRVSTNQMIPNSISLHDCKLTSQKGYHQHQEQQQQQQQQQRLSHYPPHQLESQLPMSSTLWPDVPTTELEQAAAGSSEYRLAQMLLECGSNPNAKDSNGFTVLMHAVLSDNLPAVKCLVEHGAKLNDTNHQDQTALDLLCSKAPTRGRLELLKLLIDNKADLDRTRVSDGTRLLDRLIDEHHHCADKLPFIDCLLQNGAKLGSSTWLAALGKYEIQLRLLQKLCQDGYFLYKKSSIEAAVYRFEYALKRLAELEQQLANNNHHHFHSNHISSMASQSFIPLAAKQIKYQTYLGLSRCERKRKFFKRALEFAHLAILVDSTSYEGYYSKAHILKDLGDLDDALLAIDQTQRLVMKSIENIEFRLNDLQQQEEEASMFDGCFSRLDQRRSKWIEATRLELNENLDYMQEARRFVTRLRAEIMDDKLKNGASSGSSSGATSATSSEEAGAPEKTGFLIGKTAKPIAI